MIERFQQKIQALTEHVDRVTKEYESVRVMLVAIDTSILNAEAEKQNPDTINFLRRQQKEIKKMLTKAWEEKTILIGRIQQCIEFINEESYDFKEKKLLDSFKKEVNSIVDNCDSGRNFIESNMQVG